jgi:hypothetical protein
MTIVHQFPGNLLSMGDPFRQFREIPLHFFRLSEELIRILTSKGEKMRDAFSHRRDVTGKPLADCAKNTEGYIAVTALHSSQIGHV